MKKEIERYGSLIKQCDEYIQKVETTGSGTDFDKAYIATMKKLKSRFEDKRAALTSQIGKKK